MCAHVHPVQASWVHGAWSVRQSAMQIEVKVMAVNKSIGWLVPHRRTVEDTINVAELIYGSTELAMIDS